MWTLLDICSIMRAALGEEDVLVVTSVDQMSANSNDANRLSDGVATATTLPLPINRTGPPGSGREGEAGL